MTPASQTELEYLRRRVSELERELLERKDSGTFPSPADPALFARLSEIEAVYASAPIGLCVLGPDLVFRRINDRLAEINGLPASEHLGRAVAGILPALAPQFESIRDQILSTRAAVRFRISGETPAQPGVQRTWDETWTPEWDRDGKLAAIHVAAQEITRQQQSEQALREREEQLRFHVENTPLGIVEFGPDYTITRWAGRAEEIFGYQAEEVLGKKLTDFRWIHEEDAASVASLSEEMFGGRQLRNLNVNRNYRKDGSVVWCEWYNSARVDSEGRLHSVFSVVLDVTERRNAEAAARAHQERLKLAVEAGKIGIFDWEIDTGKTIWTPEMERIFGMEPGAFGGNTDAWARHVPQEDLAQVEAELARRFAAQDEDICFDYRFLHPDGSIREVEGRGRIAYDNAGRPVRMVGTNVDVTERKQAERNLEAANAALRQANAELEEFAYVACHDIQEPLRTVNIYTQLLTRRHTGSDDAQARLYAEFVHKGVARMESLIHGLLSYSRTIHTGAEPARQLVALDDCLRGALEVLKSRVAETAAEVHSDPLPAVRADEGQLTQVFQNLLSNAIKYRKPGEPPRVQVRAVRDTSNWMISVSDQGIGFAPEHGERIFGLFKRLHRDEYPGTGLGLAICKRIIERHGGTIWAEGEVGRGASFFFTLPAGQE